MLERALPESMVELHDQARRAGERLSELTNDIQTLSHRLHSSKLDYLGIAAAASSFCKKFSEQQKVEINFSDGGIPRGVPSERGGGTTIYASVPFKTKEYDVRLAE
jgi:signal transduction histidine kinase